jgi:hypothetical protein
MIMVNDPSKRATKPLKGSFFKLPSTRAGRIRLAGLAAYTGLSIAFPGIPAALKAAVQAAVELVGKM